MTNRYQLQPDSLYQSLPWPSEYAPNRMASVHDGKHTYWVVKLETGSLQDAKSGLTKVFEAVKGHLVDVTEHLLPVATRFKVTRNILVSDLNDDGFQDFFLNNHGPEPSNGLFPGEQNALYLFNPVEGRFMEQLTPAMDFSHGSSAGDFDGDGRQDVLVNNLGSTSGTPSYLLRQLPTGEFVRQDIAATFVNALGPLTASISLNGGGASALISTQRQGNDLVMWSNITSPNPVMRILAQLPMLVDGVFEILSGDFDGNGQPDLLVVGTGDELKAANGVVVGGTLMASLVFDAGLPTQKMRQPLLDAGIAPVTTGGLYVQMVDIDNSGTTDIQISTFDTDWHPHRYVILFNNDQSAQVFPDFCGDSNVDSFYLDTNDDGVQDVVQVATNGLYIHIGTITPLQGTPKNDILDATKAGGTGYAPTGTVTITGTPTQNQVLTASNNLADADGLGAISYTWLRDGTAINAATQSTYTLTQADVGKKLSVKASYTDLLGAFENVVSSSVIPVGLVNHLPTGSVTITGTAFKGQILTVSNNLVDTDGLGTISYTWLDNGVVIPNATQSTYKLTQADTGQNISVKANYTDALGTFESVVSSDLDINKNILPTGTATIKGLSTWGTTLSITSTIKDADGIGKLSYTWQNDKTTLSKNATYTLADSDIGKQVWAVVSYIDKKGNLEEVKSNVVNVTVSDKASTVNDVLTGTEGANKLNGLAGNDTLIGGLGKDSLTGGVGADVFKFNSVNDSSALPKQADTIIDFKHAQGDKIDLSAIDANSVLPNDQAFTLISAATFSADATGQLRFDAKTSTLYGSTNADAAPEFAIVLSGVKTFVADDFAL
jgi:Ca2+-binding RTX toxin-like protein